MPEKAQITSIEALETFRAALIVYTSKARPALEEVSSDVMRTRLWLQDDRLSHWEGQVKKRQRVFEQAQQTLFAAKLSNNNEATSTAQFNYHRARRALDDAQERVRKVKIWIKKYDGLVEPWIRQMEKLHSVLSHDLPLSVAHLSEMINLLAAYAERNAPAGGNPPPVAADGPSSLPPTEPPTGAIAGPTEGPLS